MEKVFGGSTTQLRENNKFDVNQFGDSEEDCKYWFQQIQMNGFSILFRKLAHRSKAPTGGGRKPIVSSMKRRDSSEPALVVPTRTAKRTSDTDEPLVSERAGYGDHNESDEEAKRVQFARTTARGAEVAQLENDSYDEESGQSGLLVDDLRKRKRWVKLH